MQKYPANVRDPGYWYDHYGTTYDQENQYDINQFIGETHIIVGFLEKYSFKDREGQLNVL